MKDLISKAYTYIEFNHCFSDYASVWSGTPREENYERWLECIEAYDKVKEYMTDVSLKECFNLMINEF